MASGVRPRIARGLYQKNLKKKRAVCVPGDRENLGNHAKPRDKRGDSWEADASRGAMGEFRACTGIVDGFALDRLA
jgi:hypothetical protein